MVLRVEGYVELPEHRGDSGFDHAAVHRELRWLYVAHTANDALDVIDLDTMRYIDSIEGLTGVAGALVRGELGPDDREMAPVLIKALASHGLSRYRPRAVAAADHHPLL